MSDRDSSATRNFIVGASAGGLSVELDGQVRQYRWTAVEAVTASVVAYGSSSIFVLAFGFADQRTMVLSEVEPAWSNVVEKLHLHLTDVEPFTFWGPPLIAAPGVIDLYVAEG